MRAEACLGAWLQIIAQDLARDNRKLLEPFTVQISQLLHLLIKGV